MWHQRVVPAARQHLTKPLLESDVDKQIVLDFEAEEWRSIPGFLGYEASTLGRVRSLDRTIPTTAGYSRMHRGRVLRPAKAKIGYPVVNLGHNNVQCVHRLVCLAFHGEAPPGFTDVAHWDGDPGNNRPSNLRWTDRKGNMADMIRHERSNRGIRNPRAILREADVRQIRSMLNSGATRAAVGSRFGVSTSNIDHIASGRRWAWLD